MGVQIGKLNTITLVCLEQEYNTLINPLAEKIKGYINSVQNPWDWEDYSPGDPFTPGKILRNVELVTRGKAIGASYFTIPESH